MRKLWVEMSKRSNKLINCFLTIQYHNSPCMQISLRIFLSFLFNLHMRITWHPHVKPEPKLTLACQNTKQLFAYYTIYTQNLLHHQCQRLWFINNQTNVPPPHVTCLPIIAWHTIVTINQHRQIDAHYLHALGSIHSNTNNVNYI